MAQERRTARQLRDEIDRLAKTATARDRAELLHELRVYQEELTSQNEQLMHAQTALEETRDRFVELYDFAPNGYMTLDQQGVIRQINLTGAAIIGKQRSAIEGIPLLGFVAASDRSRVIDFLRRCRLDTSQAGTTLDLTLRSADGPRQVQLLCRPKLRRPGSAGREFFTAMIDMSDYKRLEDERAQWARQRGELARRLISVQDDERQRIARDLHDNLGQQLTGLRLNLDGIAMLTGLDVQVRDRVSAAHAMADELDRSLDFIASELRPTVLDLGLAAALDQFVRDWSAMFKISAELHANGVERLRVSPEVETHVYRIAQEALNNVYKHAKAQHVNIILECHPRGLLLVIEDDGHGFTLSEVERRGRRGMGLMSMQERAAIIGAALEVESVPGRGAAVFLRVPNEALQRGEDVV